MLFAALSTGSVDMYLPSGHKVGSFTIPTSTQCIAYSNGYIYTVKYSAAPSVLTRTSVFNGTSSTVSIPGVSYVNELAQSETCLYTANAGNGNSTQILDKSGTMTVGWTSATYGVNGVCYDNVTDSVWGTGFGTNKLVKLNSSTGALISDIVLSGPSNGYGCYFDGEFVYGSFGSGHLVKANPTTLAYDTLTTGNGGLNCVSDGTYLYTGYTNNMSVHKRSDNSLVRTIPTTGTVFMPIFDGANVWGFGAGSVRRIS
jgi:hypothetical protein